jgi:thymidylate synthase (FAD)
MKLVEPKIFLVGESRAFSLGVRAYLTEIGAANWVTDSPSDAEGLLELFGRGCYRSYAPGMNPNVTKVREGNKEYLANIKEQKHGSVFEHATANFLFLYVSRVFTHELVRHRVGTAMSQESLRFVRLDDIKFWIPPDIAANEAAKKIFEEAITAGERWQQELAAVLGFNAPGVSFDYKKKMTSAMRRIAPEGLATMIGWTGNFRTLRHVIETRTDPSAEHEIRLVFGKVADLATQRWPNAFGDYEVETVDGLPWYRTINSKI